MTNVPAHIAIIPDGNRRWAKQKGLPSFAGHAKGAVAMEHIVRAASDMNIGALTIWGASTANLTKRSPEEVAVLAGIFGDYFEKLGKVKELQEQDVRVRFIGRWKELLPEQATQPMMRVMEHTKGHVSRQLTFLIGYNGMEEMTTAINSLAEAKSKDANLIINESTVKSYLWTHDLPPVDLVIRTGGEPHWSAGFMMWDVADAQLHFTETLWPDFTPEIFKTIVDHFHKTERRFGQ